MLLGGEAPGEGGDAGDVAGAAGERHLPQDSITVIIGGYRGHIAYCRVPVMARDGEKILVWSLQRG